MLVGLACFLNAAEVAHKDMPPLEKSFIKIMNKSLDEFATTTNGAKKNKIALDLGKSLSNLLKDMVAKDWVGEVIKISTDNDGSARVVVVLSDKNDRTVIVMSAPSKSEDERFKIHTSIDFGTNLYNDVSELEVGDKVIFSGRFVSLSDLLLIDLLEDNSYYFARGIFQFTSIKKSK